MLRHQASRFACWLLLLVFTIQTTGCHSWKATTQPWPQAVAAKPAARYRVVTVDQQRFEADTIRVVGDSVIAVRVVKRGNVEATEQIRRLRIEDIARVELRQRDTLKTALLIGAAVLFIVVPLVGALVYESTCSSGVLCGSS